MSLSPVIVALDFSNLERARQLVKSLSPELCRLKVGKQMFTAFGPAWVEELVTKGYDVFLDLKYHDIPNTVAKACEAACNLGVWMLNVHASGGLAMMQAAKQTVDSCGKDKPLLIAVTLLTSLQVEDLTAFGISLTTEQLVTQLAMLTKQGGLDGVVCSAQEAAHLRQTCGTDFCLVTPGIRLASSDDDQKRVVTPADAMNDGSDYLVIGRPVTQSDNPVATLRHILSSISEAKA